VGHQRNPNILTSRHKVVKLTRRPRAIFTTYFKQKTKLAPIVGQSITLVFQDGKVTFGEQCGLNFLSFVTGMMWLADLGLAIWGSVVVFGAYSTWTYEGAVGETYCDYTCFMFAFVLLILRWVTMPFAICCGCMKLMCKGCPKGAQAS